MPTSPPVASKAAVEHGFFQIARWFGLAVAAAALLTVIISIVIGALKATSGADQRVRRPTVTYENFKQSADDGRADSRPDRGDTTLQQKQAEAARAAAEAEFEKRLAPHLQTIVANLSGYAAKTDQPKPSAQAIGNFVRTKFSDNRSLGGDDIAWGFIDGLQKATADLAVDGERLSRLDVNDRRRVRWDTFLSWFNDSYAAQIRADINRARMEALKAEAQKLEAPIYFYAAAVAFGVFLLGTILLVLLRIEINTRLPQD